MPELTPQQRAVAQAVCEQLGYGFFDVLQTAEPAKTNVVVAMTRAVLAAAGPLSWLSRGHRLLGTCPGCGQPDLPVTGIDQLGHTYEVCECGTPDYPHMVEQMWHREHMTGQPADQVAGTTRRATLDEVARELRYLARRGEAGARGRTQLTYAGGLRAAARRVDDLIKKETDRRARP